MMRLSLSVTLLVFSSISFADPPSDQLVQYFIHHSRAEMIMSGQIDATMNKLGGTMTPDVRKEVQRFYENTMGWPAIKDDYARLVKSTYSVDQLKAVIAFQKSPVGSPVADRNVAFSRALGELLAGRMQQASVSKLASPADSAPTESPLNDESLKVVEIVDTLDLAAWDAPPRSAGQRGSVSASMPTRLLSRYATPPPSSTLCP
jgi:hypothetical protein